MNDSEGIPGPVRPGARRRRQYCLPRTCSKRWRTRSRRATSGRAGHGIVPERPSGAAARFAQCRCRALHGKRATLWLFRLGWRPPARHQRGCRSSGFLTNDHADGAALGRKGRPRRLELPGGLMNEERTTVSSIGSIGGRASPKKRRNDNPRNHDQDRCAEDRHRDLTGRVLCVLLWRTRLRLPANLLLFLTWFL